MHAQIPEVSLKFRISPVLALILMAASWPFGLAYGVDAPFFKNANYEIITERNIKNVVNSFRSTDITSVLVEAGPKLINSFLNENYVDKLIIYESTSKLGPNGVDWFKEDNAVEKLGFKLESSYKIESDTKKIFIK